MTDLKIRPSLPLEKELISRNEWIVKLRWIASGATILVVLGTRYLLNISLPLIPLISIGAAVGLYNAVFIWYIRYLKRKEESAYVVRWFANFQIGADWIALIFLVHYFGGAESPLMFYFIFHIIISAILLPRRMCFFQSIFASTLILCLALLEYINFIPHIFLPPLVISSFYNQFFPLSTYLFFFISALFITFYLATSITTQLREREKELEERSIRDDLTGLYSRSYFLARAKEEITRSSLEGNSLSLLFCDIDNFKAINRIKGYAQGDKTLCQVAKIIKSSLKEEDTFCRYGGDEFAVLLPKADSSGALKVAERIHWAFFNKKGAQGYSSLNISIGVASYPTHGSSVKDLVAKAERSMISAKHHSEKKTVVWGEKIKDVEEFYKKEVLLEVIYSLAETVNIKDGYAGEHSRFVAEQASFLAKKMGLERERIKKVKITALLHDVGKLLVPDEILNKPGPLTDEEMRIVRKHATDSTKITQYLRSLKEMEPLIRAVHERWDGKGYPDGLAGKRIPIESRIVALVDTYQALISDRPYRKKFSKQEAIKILQEEARKKFDPKLVEIFLEILS